MTTSLSRGVRYPAYFNLGNIRFEVLQVDAPRREGDKYIYPVHLLQIHDPNIR